MKKLSFFKHHSDIIGSSLSFICLIHCLLLPILIATTPFLFFLSFMNTPLAELIMVVLAVLNSIMAVTLGFPKHKSYIAPAMLISGAILLVSHYFLHDLIKSADVFIIVGVILIGSGHLLNKKLCNKCKKCNLNEQ